MSEKGLQALLRTYHGVRTFESACEMRRKSTGRSRCQGRSRLARRRRESDIGLRRVVLPSEEIGAMFEPMERFDEPSSGDVRNWLSLEIQQQILLYLVNVCYGTMGHNRWRLRTTHEREREREEKVIIGNTCVRIHSLADRAIILFLSLSSGFNIGLPFCCTLMQMSS